MSVFKISQDTTLSSAAKRYSSKLGWKVFPVHTPGPNGLCTCGKVPCENAGKHPRTLNGLKDATGSQDQIIKWWSDWPEAGIGCPTGKVNGFFVLDVDPRHGGDISLEAIERKYGSLPQTRHHKTGGGGMHYFFAMPNGQQIPNSSGVVGPGLDIRGDGGYVILPPSLHTTGTKYDMNGGDIPINDPPEWLVNLVTQRPSVPQQHTPSTIRSSGFKLPDKISSGQRNDVMFRFARSLSRHEISIDAAKVLLKMENRVKCDPPLSDDEIDQLTESAYSSRYEQGGHPFVNPDVVQVAPDLPGPERHPITFELTDKPFRRDGVGNSNRFIKAFGDVLRYNTDNEQWHYWTGQLWKPVHGTFVEQLGKEVAVSIYTEIPYYAGTPEEKDHASFARQSNKRPEIVSMISLSRGNLSIHASEFDTSPFKLNMQNGVFDLESLTFHAGGIKEEYHSKQTGVEYDPAADCPEWRAHVSKVLQDDPEMIKTFQTSLGYSILGHHSEYLFIPYGSGKNGKSVTLQAVRKVLGDYAATISPDTLSDFGKFGKKIREDLARLQGKRFVFTSEPNKSVSLDTELIKRVTGGDEIVAEFKYGHEFDYKPQLSIWLSTNHIPKIKETTEAIKSRIRMFPFEYWFKPEERKNQDDIIKYFIDVEGPGIFNWLIDGLRMFYENGNHIPFCTKVMSASDRAILENDPLERCIKEIAIVGEEGSMIERKDWFHKVSSWFLQNDEGEVHAKQIVNMMRDKGYDEKRKTDGRYWLGIRLKKAGEQEVRNL